MISFRPLLMLRRVRGHSMLPSLEHGDIVWATGLSSPQSLQPGQVVVIRHEGIEIIKRVVEVENGEIIVQGDNAADSTDSRQFGPLPLSAVRGKVIWPNVDTDSFRRV